MERLFAMTKKGTLYFLLILTPLISGHSALADMSIESYKMFTRSSGEYKERAENYAVAAGRGVFWANIVAETRGRIPLFCWPDKLGSDKGIILSILDQELRKPSKPYKPNHPIEFVLVVAFQERFPCD